MNIVTLIGNLGRAPEVRTTRNGTPVASFSVATTYQNGRGESYTDWHNVTVWGDDANEIAKLGKGERVIVVGRSQTRSYEDQNGQKRYLTEVVVSGPGTAVGTVIRRPLEQSAQKAKGVEPAPAQSFIDDEVPF